MIIVTGSLVVRDGHLAEAIAASLDHVHRSRTEPGCISHAVHQNVENPSRLEFVEQWADPAALVAHFAVPATRAFAKAIARLSVDPPALDIFEARRVDAAALMAQARGTP